MSTTFKKGDAVHWDSSSGTSHGTVVKKITGKAQIKGHVAKASSDAPEYEVKSSATGAHAIHRPGALHRDSSK